MLPGNARGTRLDREGGREAAPDRDTDVSCILHLLYKCVGNCACRASVLEQSPWVQTVSLRTATSALPHRGCLSPLMICASSRSTWRGPSMGSSLLLPA